MRPDGLQEVQRQDVDVPLGDWGGSVGSLMASDLRALFTGLSAPFQARLGVPADETSGLVDEMSSELDEYRTIHTYGVAFGRKPT